VKDQTVLLMEFPKKTESYRLHENFVEMPPKKCARPPNVNETEAAKKKARSI
jgi:hypothetical protein